MVFSNNLLMGAASSTGGAAAGWVPKGAVWFDGAADEMTRTMSTGTEEVFTISFWEKLALAQAASLYPTQFSATSGGAAASSIQHDMDSGSDGMLYFNSSVDNKPNLKTTAAYRDPTAWRHVFIAYDSTPSTPSINSIYMAVNGVIQTDLGSPIYYPAQDGVTDFNTANVHHIGSRVSSANQWFNGYLSEFVFLNGVAALPSDFGEENSDGVWVPKDPTDIIATASSTNTFWLDFADSSALGNDVSGNNNDFTTVSMSSANWTYDRPADSGSTIGNFATMMPIYVVGTPSSATYTNGNLTSTCPASSAAWSGFFTGTTGKYYAETTWDSGANIYWNLGNKDALSVPGGSWKVDTWVLSSDGKAYAEEAYGPAGNTVIFGPASTGDTIGWAIDYENDAVWGHYNGTWIDGTGGSASSGTVLATVGTSTTTYAIFTGILSEAMMVGCRDVGTGSTATHNFGQTTFVEAAPSGFKLMATQNLPAPSITKPSDHFLPIIYEGNGGGQRVGNFIPFTDAYAVDNSCLLQGESSQYLSIAKENLTTPTGGTTNGNQKFTLSFWLKLVKNNDNASDGNGSVVYGTSADSGSGASMIQWGWNSTQGPAFNYTDWSNESGGGSNWLRRVLGNATTTSGPQGGKVNYDFSNWHHYVIASDWTTGGGESGNDAACEVYIDGQLQSYFLYDGTELVKSNPATSNYSGIMSDIADQNIGLYPAGSRYGYFYMAEVIGVDGQKLTPSVFGQTDTSTNRWIPKDPTSTLASASDFGNNGFYLDMASANDLGNDVSGNDNDWTMNNMDATNGSNQMYDTPTRNMAVMSSTWISGSAGTLTQGNLYMTQGSGTEGNAALFMDSPPIKPLVGSLKLYWEILCVDTTGANGRIGFQDYSATAFGLANGYWYQAAGAYNNHNVVATSGLSTWTDGDRLNFAVDEATGKFWFGKNGVWEASGNPATGANPIGVLTNSVLPCVFNDSGVSTLKFTANFGQWRYFDGAATTLATDAGGYFSDTVPSDFVALTQDNMAENTAGITGFSWIKNRDAGDDHILQDRVRGIYKYIISNDTDIETTDTNSVQRFLQQGVQIGNMDEVNTSAESFVLWQWAANGTGSSLNVATADVNGATSSTTALVVDGNSGTIEAGMYVAGTGVSGTVTVASLSDQNNLVLSSAQSLSDDVAITFSTSAGATLASTVSANTTAGFSVIQWTGTGANATIGHGLGSQIPKFWAVKNTATTNGWMVGHASLANTSFLQINNTDVVDTNGAAIWNSTYPAADIISLGDNVGANGSTSTDNMICYAWAEVEGYSKFGSYTGNNLADGPFIYTGFKPAWVLIKRYSDDGYAWHIQDSIRSPYNPTNNGLNPNDTNTENTGGARYDFTATGFKLRTDDGGYNGAQSYIYAAFAENPFGGSGVAQAKAR